MSNSGKLRDMNKALYAAAFHLMEAGKYLSNAEDFREEAGYLLEMAQFFADTIKIEPSKVTAERMQSILDEIINDSEEV